MKKILLFISLVFLINCEQNFKKIGSESIKGKISYKEIYGYKYKNYYLYIQNPTNTRLIEVDADTYDEYKKGDSILLIIEKYQIPCKDNEDWKKPKVTYNK